MPCVVLAVCASGRTHGCNITSTGGSIEEMSDKASDVLRVFREEFMKGIHEALPQTPPKPPKKP